MVMTFLVMVDEASKLANTAMIFMHDVKQNRNVTGEEVWDVIMKRWISEHGAPRMIRMDPEGAFRSAFMVERCSDFNIEMDISAGEAHWQMGPTEQVIQDLDGTMRKLDNGRTDLSPNELLARATLAHNELERHVGFSPNQCHMVVAGPGTTLCVSQSSKIHKHLQAKLVSLKISKGSRLPKKLI